MAARSGGRTVATKALLGSGLEAEPGGYGRELEAAQSALAAATWASGQDGGPCDEEAHKRPTDYDYQGRKRGTLEGMGRGTHLLERGMRHDCESAVGGTLAQPAAGDVPCVA